MAQSVEIWFGPKVDFLEVLFSDAPGFMRETENDAIMERVDVEGNILGFSVMNVSRFTAKIADGGGESRYTNHHRDIFPSTHRDNRMCTTSF